MKHTLFLLGLSAAGAAGVLTRYWVTQLAVQSSWTQLPFGTLSVNVIGSFLIGYLSIMLINKWSVDQSLQLIVLSGFLGGFTTFSAFSLETLQLLQATQYARAAVYVTSSVALTLLGCGAGLMLAKRMV